MARLRFRSDWFLEISPQALYETEFEAIIQQNVELLRDNAIIVPFKQTVYASEFESARADLALIDKDYREWWVIEVELLAHDLHRHVLPQVRTLADGRYGSEHAAALLRHKPDLDEDKLLTMMRGEQPQVLVVCNRYNEEWARELRSLGAAYIAFSLFRSDLDQDIFLLDGNLPRPRADHITRLTPAVGIPRFLRVLSPAALPPMPDGTITLLYEGKQTEWVKIDTANQCFLTSKSRFPISMRSSYVIVREGDGPLIIKEDEGKIR